MWWWVLIWVLLVMIAGAYLASRAWGVWGGFMALTAEVCRSSETVAGLLAQAERLGERAPAPSPDVFGDPRQLRRERDVTRDSLKRQRRARQAARRPSWAKHLD
jgi:hypothetical protein